MKRALALALSLVLTLPAVALGASEAPVEEETFDPSIEWNLHTWGPELKLGPIDMSLNKAVAYLLLGALVTCVIGIVLMRVPRGRGPDRGQGLGETG